MAPTPTHNPRENAEIRGANNPRLKHQTAAAPTDGEVQEVQEAAPAAPVLPVISAPAPSGQRGAHAASPMKPVDTAYHQKTYHSFAEQLRAHQPGAGAQPATPDTAVFYDADRYKAQRQKKPLGKMAIVAGILAAIAIGVGLWFYFYPPVYGISVNGADRIVVRGTSLDDLIDAGAASPNPGNLIAVDNTLLQEGGGARFSATVDGAETDDGDYQVGPDDIVLINDGKDTMETFSSHTLTIEPGRSERGKGAIHAYIEGTPGVVLEKVGDVSGITVKEEQTVLSDGGVVKYDANTNGEKVIALTFDDGPWPDTTAQILDILAANNAKATFFTIGEQIGNFPEQVQRAAAEGHQICTHSWDHADGSGQGVNLTYMSPEEQVSEIQRGYDAITSVTGTDASHVIRTPGGNFYGDLVWTIQPLVSAEINWNIDTEDWRRPGAEVIANRILTAQPGDIILMHDGGGDRSQTVAALKTALPQLAAQGYRFVTIDELMALSTPQQAIEAGLATE